MTAPVPITDKSVLLSIVNTSRRLQSRILRSGFKPTPDLQTQPQPHPFPSFLSLPYPHDIISCVEDSSTSSEVKSRIIAKVSQWYRGMQDALQSEYAKTLCQLEGVPQLPGMSAQSRLHEVYESLFTQRVAKFRDDVEHALRRAAANAQVPTNKGSRRIPFNHECSPLLETYFEYNAYPSALDRALLAKKSSMCPRQIEVWFQNHRRRAKKEGRRLRRLSQDPLPHELNFEHLSASVPQLLVPEEEPKTMPLKESLSPTLVVTTLPPTPAPPHTDNALCAPAPAHAFPTKYPPTPSHISCLHSGKTWSFPAPEWPRRASVKAPTRNGKTPMTPDELAVEFQKSVAITGSDGVKRPQAALSAPAWYPFTTSLPAAPHFALIRKHTPPPSAPAPAPAPTSTAAPAVQFNFNSQPLEPHSLRAKTSNLTTYKRPSPYLPRPPPKTKPLSRATSNASLSSISSVSSDESDLVRTPPASPSPFARYISLPKDLGLAFAPRYPDWEGYFVPP